MKISKTTRKNQREILDSRLISVDSIRKFSPMPRSGWLKAIRGALGLSTKQLGKRIDVTAQAVLRMEQREVKGSVTLAGLEKAAQAMDCELIYAIVPKQPNKSLDEILRKRALEVANVILAKVDHSMKLEDQELSQGQKEKQIENLVNELVNNLDHRLWEKL